MNLLRSLAVAGILLSVTPTIAQNIPVSATTTATKVDQNCARSCPKLNITDDQKQKLSSLRDQYELNTAQKKAELKVAERQLRQLFSDANIDKQQALTLQNKINGLRDDLTLSRLNFKLAACDIFTPEQRREFREMREHRWMRRGGDHRGGSAKYFSSKEKEGGTTNS